MGKNVKSKYFIRESSEFHMLRNVILRLKRTFSKMECAGEEMYLTDVWTLWIQNNE